MNVVMPSATLTDRVVMGDVYIALGTALVVILIFAVAVFVQRRQPQTLPPVPVEAASDGSAASVSISGSADRIEKVATSLETRMGAIEQRQLTDEKRLIDTEHSVNNIRAALAALPSKDAVHKLEVDLTALSGRVAAMDGTTLATQRAVERIETLLMRPAP